MADPDRFTVIPEARFDLAGAERLHQLFAVARNKRDDAWFADFRRAAWNASVVVASPPIFCAPDGFLYMRLALPSPNQPFQSNCLSNLCAACAERGWGIAFFAEDADPPEAVQYAIPTGVLESLRSFGDWDGDPVDQAETQGETTATEIAVTAAREVLVAAPSAQYLPPHTAKLLRDYLVKRWQLAEPSVALLIDTELKPTRNLVIGKKHSEFPDAAAVDRQMQMLLWYLPPARSLVLMPEDWSLDQMTPLSALVGSGDAP
jgi:hypothetical protein